MLENRVEAGRLLAARLEHLRGERPVVLALPRGGVPVGHEIARALGAPLDILLVRKIGAPFQPELAIGAVVDGDHPEILRDSRLIAETGASESYVQAEAERQLKEIVRRRRLYFHRHAPVDVAGRTVILVDDGIATGSTVRVALRALARRSPARRVLAVPVAPADTLAALRGDVDEIHCLETPEPFFAIGAHYADFDQFEDEAVIKLLEGAPSSEAAMNRGTEP